MKVKTVAIGEVIPYARNPRKNADAIAKVAGSLNEYGWQQPIVVDKNMVVIAGHTRLEAARTLGMEKVPVQIAEDLTEAQVKAYRIADNRVSQEAEWDIDLLKIELADLDNLDFNLLLTGFDEDELNGMLIEAVEEGLTDEDEVPEAPKVPVTVKGDIWQLGNHRVMCGDSTSIDEAEKLMDGQLADLLLTDPPYNVAYTGKTKDALTIQNDEKTDTEFRQFLTDAFTAADAVMKAGACFYIWHADSEGYNFRGACYDVEWTVRQCLIWNKNTMVMGRQDYHWKHEPCLYGWKEGASHLWASDRKQTTVLDFARPTRNAEHPTMKPVELMAYQIENNTKGADIVLDLFGGSGSTLIAAEKLGRKANLMELDETYVDVIISRWQDFTGKEAVHQETGKTYNEMKAAKDGGSE